MKNEHRNQNEISHLMRVIVLVSAKVSLHSNIVSHVGTVYLNDQTFSRKYHIHTVCHQNAFVDEQLSDSSKQTFYHTGHICVV